MAKRRMFSKEITDSDEFCNMSSSSQALYFHLNQGADDDGFNNQIQMAMFKAHASMDDLRVLLTKNFIIRFESGVIVIKHWRLHNSLRKDRHHSTNYQEELALLKLKKNGSYTLSDEETVWLPNGCQMVALGEDREGKERLGKVSLVEERKEEEKEEEKAEPSSSVHSSHSSKEKREFLGGTLGMGVVMLSEKQKDDLLDKLSLDEFNRYVEVVADCELSGKHFTKKSHYQAILEMAEADRQVADKPIPDKKDKPRYGSFDVDEAFQAALARSQMV